jgi:hypothetical protein
VILTGDKLEQIGKALYGASWPTIMADRLKKSRRTIFNYRDSPRGMDQTFRRQIEHLIDDQMATLANLRAELAEGPTE